MNNSKKKVLVIGPLPPPIAGPEIVTKTLVESTEFNDTFDVDVINTTMKSNNVNKGKVDLFSVAKLAHYFLILLYNLLLNRADFIFYLPTSATRAGWGRDGGTLFLCKVFRVKHALLFQGAHYSHFFTSLNVRERQLIKWLLKDALPFVQSECLKEQLSSVANIDKVVVLPNMVKRSFYKEFDSKNEQSEIRVLFVGHLTVAKGFNCLVKAFKLMKNPEKICIDILGEYRKYSKNIQKNVLTGEELPNEDPKELYEKLLNQEEKKQFNFHGDQVQGQQKVDVFKNADIFVLPSYSESFSTAMLEGMAAGLSTVVTPVGAAKDVVQNENNGLLIDIGSPESIANVLDKLVVDQDLRERTALNARRLVSERYCDDVVVKGLINNINQFMSNDYETSSTELSNR